MSARWLPRAWALFAALAATAAVGLVAAVEAGRSPPKVEDVRQTAFLAWFDRTKPVLEYTDSAFESPLPAITPEVAKLESPFGRAAVSRSPIGLSGQRDYAFAVFEDKSGRGTWTVLRPEGAQQRLEAMARKWNVAFRGDYRAVYEDIAAAMRVRPFRPLGLRLGDPDIAAAAALLTLIYLAGLLALARWAAPAAGPPSLPMGRPGAGWLAWALLALGAWFVAGALIMARIAQHQLADPRIGAAHAVLECAVILALALAFAGALRRMARGLMAASAPAT